ncbi:zinc finger protein 91 [Lingula anatina]|uniref:Zinc finger protein 91 n=1 Tax=Lingula anatina TaxID=7574 RepID=A0A1S3JKD5_LINAN|nr:zinc finger protein 91 [Lingula anatina]|eukprot:XP_013410837.1 zinc finger protein 91 [Lingula anatina]
MMDLEEDNDPHICLNCNTTIVGLMNYITHKKSLCPAKKPSPARATTVSRSLPHETAAASNINNTTHINIYSNYTCTDTVALSNNFSSTDPVQERRSFVTTEGTATISDKDNLTCTEVTPVTTDFLFDFANAVTTFSAQTSSNSSVRNFGGEPSCSPIYTQSNLSLDVGDASNGFSLPVLSPPSDQPGKAQDSNIPLEEKDQDVKRPEDFFSSLNLQVKPRTTGKSVQTKDVVSYTPAENEKDKSLPISNLLENLGFCSDSENEEYDEESEELSGEEEEDESEDETWKPGSRPPRGHTGGKWEPGSRPPRGHTGGKWKPGSRPPRGHTGGKWEPGSRPPRGHTGGKWEPGSRPPRGHTGGKWKPGSRPPRGHTGGKWKPDTQQTRSQGGGKTIPNTVAEGGGKWKPSDSSSPPPCHTGGKWMPVETVGEKSTNTAQPGAPLGIHDGNTNLDQQPEDGAVNSSQREEPCSLDEWMDGDNSFSDFGEDDREKSINSVRLETEGKKHKKKVKIADSLDGKYYCQPCQKSFRTKYTYAYHFDSKNHKLNVKIASQHGDTNEKTFSDYSFRKNVEDSSDRVVESDRSGTGTAGIKHGSGNEIQDSVDGRYYCQPCQKSFINKYTHAYHCESNSHKLCVKVASVSKDSTEPFSHKTSANEGGTNNKANEQGDTTQGPSDIHNRRKTREETCSCEEEEGSVEGGREPSEADTEDYYSGTCDPDVNNKVNESHEWENAIGQGDANEDEDNDHDTKCGPDFVYSCVPCGRTFNSKYTYAYHLESGLHKRRSGPKEPEEKEDVKIICRPCDRVFHNKYNMARHLLTGLHCKKAKGHPEELNLIVRYQALMLRLSPYQCQICLFFCNSHSDLKIHMATADHVTKTWDLIGPMMCGICKFTCETNETMLKHMELAEHLKALKSTDRVCVIKESRFLINCKICGKKVHSASQLEKHLNTKHTNPPKEKHTPVCAQCGITCISNYALNIHVRRIHTKERPFHCNICQVSFFDHYTLFLHEMSIKHQKMCNQKNGENNKPKKKLESRDKAKKNGKKSLYKCRQCDYTVTVHAQLRQHFIQAHADAVQECKVCGITFCDKYKLKAHCNTSGHRRKEQLAEQADVHVFSCDICKRKFYSSKTYKKHLVSAHAESCGMDLMGSAHETQEKYKDFLSSIQQSRSKVPCPDCGKHVAPRYMESHLRVHTGELPFKCTQCSTCFSHVDTLRRHVYHVHLKEPRGTCNLCKKSFFTSHGYKVHMLSHDKNAVKQFVCDVCGAEFWTQSSLNLHQKNHQKNFQCPYENCRVKVAYKNDLKLHMRVHSNERPYLCDLCGYAGKGQQALTRHRRTHTGERNYSCDYCPYKSTDCTKMKRHMRIHIGSKPFKCPYCEYSCNTLENVRKHILKSKKHKDCFVYPCRFCSYGSNSSKEFKSHILSEHKDQISDSGTIDVVSVYSGLYVKIEDLKAPAEGMKIFQVKEHTGSSYNTGKKKGAGGEKQRSKLKRKCENDHSYDALSKKTRGNESADVPTAVSTSESAINADGPHIITDSIGDEVTVVINFTNSNDHRTTGSSVFTPAGNTNNKNGRQSELPFKCTQCSTCFSHVDTLRRHVYHVHLKEPRGTCNLCKKSFFTSHGYKVHMLSHDKNAVKQFVCDVCGAEFWTQSSLNLHQKNHQKNFQCPYENCRVKVAYKNDLKLHMRVHSNERPYLCDLCGYAGKGQQALTRHRRTHTGERNYSCDYCPYKSTDCTKMKRHMRIHIGSKPFKCPYCEYSCNTLENVRKHILKSKKHKDCFVYPCRFCSYGSNSSKEFKSHILNVHKDQISDSDTIDVVSVYSGLYVKIEDLKAPAEGMKIFQVKEHTGSSYNTGKKKGAGGEKQRSKLKRKCENDHSYDALSKKTRGNESADVPTAVSSSASAINGDGPHIITDSIGDEVTVVINFTNSNDHRTTGSSVFTPAGNMNNKNGRQK